jgi:hypothetical protein
MDQTKMMMVKLVGEIEGLRMVSDSDISQVNLGSDKYDIQKVHSKLKRNGWHTTVLALPHTETYYIRIFIHPLKKKEVTVKFIDDLEWAAKLAKKESA